MCTHRYYDPYTGRFVNRDPIGMDGGINLYNHVANNPINYADPEGLQNAGVLDPPVAPGTEVYVPRTPGQPLAVPRGGFGGGWRLVGMTCAFAIYFFFAAEGQAGGPGDELPNPPGPAKTNCAKALKLLKQADRLSQKYNSKIPLSRLNALKAGIAAKTITSYDLPGTLQREFPGEFAGWSLKRIEDHCGSSGTS